MIRRGIVIVVSSGIVASLACADILGIHDLPDATDDGGSLDAGPTDGGSTDASPRCDPYAPLGPMTLVPGLPNGGSVIDESVAPDELTAYVGEIQGTDLFTPPKLTQYTRSTASGTFANPTTVNKAASSLRPTVDNLTAVYGDVEPTDADPVFAQRVFVVGRADAAAPFPFGSATMVFHQQSGYEVAPVIRGDGQEIFFTSFGSAMVAYHAYADSGFQSAVPAPDLGASVASALSPDGLVIYVEESTPEVLTRPDPSSPFGNAQQVTFPDAGNPQFYYVPVAVSADYCTVYVFENMRTKSQDGGYDFSGALFVAHKTPQ